MILLNPKNHVRKYPDEKSRQIMLETIEFFENKGLKKSNWTGIKKPSIMISLSS